MINEIHHKMKQILGKIKSPKLSHHPTALSIDDYRNENFRVFRALRYFATNLQKEIEWNQEQLRKLNNLKQNPGLFYNQFVNSATSLNAESLQNHFQRHVIEGIELHSKYHATHSKRFNTIKELMPLSKYEKLVRISLKYGGIPEYFVYDKKRHDVFFVSEDPTPQTKLWSEVVKRNNVTKVIFLK